MLRYVASLGVATKREEYKHLPMILAASLGVWLVSVVAGMITGTPLRR